MRITDLLKSSDVLLGLDAHSKRYALETLAGHAARDTGLPARRILDVLLERERLGSTAVGRGVAIPHGRLEGLAGIHGFLARLASPVAFDAVDDAPVDLVFLLLAPESAGANHLRALARISRLLRDEVVCARLRAAATPADALAALEAADALAYAA